MYQIEKAQPVWGNTAQPDTYLIFRKQFTWDGTETVHLQISADSTYEVQINGHSVPIQQTADFPNDRTFSDADVTPYMKAGNNLIEVLVHYIGDDFLTYQKGVPYLQAAVSAGDKLLTATGPDWECSEETPYHSGLCCKLTVQLGFVFEYDSSRKPEKWYPAVPAAPAGKLVPRHVPQLEEKPIPPAILTAAGPLIRLKEEKTFAGSCAADYLQSVFPAKLFEEVNLEGNPWIRRKLKVGTGNSYAFRPVADFSNANGFYAIIDLGRETVGYLTLKIQASAGTIVDIAHGEHIDDGRVRASIGSRNFADRVICREGMNEFTCRHRRIGARYLELHITGFGSGKIVLHDARLIPVELPLPPVAEFTCSDHIPEKLHDLSVATLKLCMHEHYEDCPWREQGLYAYDSRNQIIEGYYVWGNWKFAEASLDLLGKSFDGKRYLTLTSPGRHELTIPVFTMVWIAELFEHETFSGSTALFTRWHAVVDQILDRALSEKVPGHEEFYHPGDDDHTWNFCEWQKDLNWIKDHPQSVYNLYLREALIAASEMHNHAGNTERSRFLREKADALGQALVKTFLREDGAVVANTPMYTGKLTEHVQALYLTAGLMPQQQFTRIADAFRSKSMWEITLSGYIYLIRGLASAGPAGRKILAERMQEVFEPILLSGATSIWETVNGGDDFDYAGSLCHAWSAVFPFYSGSVILGVTPLEPGFRKFRVRPYTCGLSHAEGSVPTPYGSIHVRWRKNDSGKTGITVEHPAETECIFDEWEECPLSEMKTEISGGNFKSLKKEAKNLV